MRKIITLFLIIFSIVTNAQNDFFSNNRIILSLKKEINEPVTNLNQIKKLKFLFNDYPINTIKPLDIARTNVLNGRPVLVIFNNPINIETIIQKLKDTNLFDYVEPDFISFGSGKKDESYISYDIRFIPTLTTIPNDQFFFRQWGLHNNGSFTLSPSLVDADVDMIEAWDITTGSPNIKMAVIDTGVRMNHPEFSGRFFSNSSETINGLDDDGNGYVDDINGWDFVNNDNNPTDDQGHGTNVTGIAMANANNNIGYAGVDWNCKLLPIKVLDFNNSGFNSNIIASIYYSIDRNVDLISISIGSSGFSTAYQNAVNQAYSLNIPIIACMMNFNNNTSYYPAAFNNTIAVGSTNPNDNRTVPFFWSSTSGSNYGNHIDVVAPGNYIYGLSHTSNSGYETYWGGTSQATPLVSGIVSLMLSLNPNLTVDQINIILRNTAEDQIGNPIEDTFGWDQYYGAGRVNAFNALSQVQSLSNEDIIYNEDIKIYPNPVKEILNFKSSVNPYSFSISIHDITGRLVKDYHKVNNSIDVSQLKNGVYILNIDYDKNKIIKKFIKE
ncbi:MAG: S8 family peptidase [Flavobacterium sp.]|nr:S8 family peptidase [Flavobacterium sp.]